MNRVKRKKKNIDNKKILKKFLSLLIVFCLVLCLMYMFDKRNKLFNIENSSNKIMYLASNTSIVNTFALEEIKNSNETTLAKKLVEKETLARGTKVEVIDKYIEFEKQKYHLIKLDNNEYYIKDINLVFKKEDAVLENNIYVRSATSILNADGSNKIIGLADKGEKLEVVDYDKINEDGTVNMYIIKKEGQEGLIYGKYVTYTKEKSLLNHMPDKYNPIHNKIKNSYGGGEAINLDFYPHEKLEFENNKMPDSVYALYLNCESNVINNIDAYIEFAKTTQINAFVVDIKDNESPAYPAKVFEELSPTNYKKAINSHDNYKNAITKLKNAGFYVIGRITVFKDNYYVQDHPEVAISSKNTGAPYQHNKSYWPSAYNRDVWYYNVALAKEAVEEFGFNEINFDYVRFPDRMNSVVNIVDLKNIYNESKAQAIQRFVQYAKDVLHGMNTYISIDVFGETTNETYTTAYGQYWPAISNVADVICGMPYPDHFDAGSYGIEKPWNEPYKLMNYWGKYASDRQQESPTPAKVRTWIQAYDVLKYKDSNGIAYGAEQVEAQIRGLYDSGITDGYITWLSNSSLNKYKSQAQAFSIDYRKEYIEKNG